MKKVWVILVRVPQAGGGSKIELGRPSGGPAYAFITREKAETAAQLWGDAYVKGDVWVEQREAL